MPAGTAINWPKLDRLTRISVKIHNPEKYHAKCPKNVEKFLKKYHLNTKNQHQKGQIHHKCPFF